MVPDAIPVDTLRRVLVVKLRHHGDVLLTSPVLSTLKGAVPRAEIDALVYSDTMPMLEGHPAIAQLHGIDRGWKRRGPFAQAAAEWQLLSRLRARHYDLVVHLTEHPRGAWLARLTGARWAVAPKTARAGAWWRGSFTHLYPTPGNGRRHAVERNLDALRRVGIVPREADKRVVLVPGADAEARVAALLGEHGLSARAFVHLHPAARWLFKCWPATKVAALADALAESGMPVVLTSAPVSGELALVAETLAAARAKHIDLSGQLSLRELAALTARARLFVGVDSVPMHIAASMQKPVVALFGPSGEFEWGPWNTASRIVTSELHPCRPCGLDGCGGGKLSECLTTLPVERVLAACAELLAS